MATRKLGECSSRAGRFDVLIYWCLFVAPGIAALCTPEFSKECVKKVLTQPV